MISEVALVVRLTIACILGGAIGLQREGANRPAGFRTHVLVALGAALIMLVSIYGFDALGRVQDPARLAAQVVSGIGFLGAGTIMREGANIRGLTTAASLWVVAGIGLACGAGFYLGAVTTTVLVYITLALFARLEQGLIHPANYVRLQLLMRDQPGQLGRVGATLGTKRISIRNISMDHSEVEEGQVQVQIDLKLPSTIGVTDVVSELASLPGVVKVCQR